MSYDGLCLPDVEASLLSYFFGRRDQFPLFVSGTEWPADVMRESKKFNLGDITYGSFFLLLDVLCPSF
jgi:hypothetical protein